MEYDTDREMRSETKSDDEKSDMDTVTAVERENIKHEISNMSFEDLQKLKEKIGIKIYNETIFGTTKQPKSNFKRVNKNRPREMSSKKQKNIKKEILHVKKQIPRDPRFDSLCGSFNENIFRANYKFLYDMKKKEYIQLQKEYQNTQDPQEQKKIKFLMQRLNNQINEYDKQEKKKNKLQEETREIRNKLRKGEKPTFKKKSEKKLEDLVEKYEELKKSNKLQKHIEKRSKKLAVKDKKKLNITKL